MNPELGKATNQQTDWPACSRDPISAFLLRLPVAGIVNETWRLPSMGAEDFNSVALAYQQVP